MRVIENSNKRLLDKSGKKKRKLVICYERGDATRGEFKKKGRWRQSTRVTNFRNEKTGNREKKTGG